MSRLQPRTARTSRLALAWRSPAPFLISKVTDGILSFLSWTENHWRRCGLCRSVRAQSGLSGVSWCTSSVGAAEAQVLLWWFPSNTQIEHTWMELQRRLLSKTHDSMTRSQYTIDNLPSDSKCPLHHVGEFPFDVWKIPPDAYWSIFYKMRKHILVM